MQITIIPALFQEQVRDHAPQPAVRQILVVPLVPVLLDRQGGQVEGCAHLPDAGDAHQGLGHAFRDCRDQVGGGHESAEPEEVGQLQCDVAFDAQAFQLFFDQFLSVPDAVTTTWFSRLNMACVNREWILGCSLRTTQVNPCSKSFCW